MSIKSNTQPDEFEHSRRHVTHFLSPDQVKITAALLLVATGIVFFLAEGGILSYSSSWWVIYIGIPGLVLLWSAYATYRHVGAMNGMATIQLILGIIAILLSVIFIVDPHWSFTTTWFNWRNIPILGAINWNSIWPWILVLLGAALIYDGVRRHVAGTGVFGAILVVVGAVFILNISWNAVWPLAIVAAGIGLLFSNRRQR